jgi:N-acyl homoserine lactone hydrolase
MTEYTIHPLVVGINETDQGIMTYQRGYGTRIHLPIYVFYLSGGDKHILVDTGLEDFIVPDGVEEKYGFKVMEFEEALASVGITPEQVDLVIQTHLHNDHMENTYKCIKAEVVVQKAELEFARNPHPIDHRYFAELLDGLNYRVVEGDVEIEPGIKLLFTPGHTPGGQSVMVDTAAGKTVITGFCSNDKNFPPNAPVVAPGVHINAIEAMESAQRVKDAADLILPCHDLSLGAKGRIP